MAKENKDSKTNVRYWSGVALVIFLVLIYTLVAPFPIWLIGFPALFMGFDLESILKSFINKK